MKNFRRHFKSLVLLNGCALAGLYMINRHLKAASLKRNILRPETGHYFQWREGRIFYHVNGSGPRPLLLIHNTEFSSSAWEWNSVISGLSTRYTVYSIDLLGCGRSDKPALTYTNYLYVQLITAFIEQVIKAPADIMASGLSSSFAVMSALIRDDLVSGLYMISPKRPLQLGLTPDRKGRAARGLLSLPVIGESLYLLITGKQNMEYILEEKYFYNPFKLKQKMIDASCEAAQSGSGSGRFFLGSLSGRYLNWNITRAIKQISQPVTLLYGEKSKSGKSDAAIYQKLNPSIRVIGIPETGALPHMENASAFLSSLWTR